MIRLLRSTGTDITETFYMNGDATDCDSDLVAVTVTRENGTILAAGAGVPTGNDGEYRFALTATDTAALDFLTVTWAGAIDGDAQTITSYVEVCGAFLTSLAELRKTTPLNDAVTYTVADLIDGRTLAEAALEDACGVAFAPRYFRTKVDGTGTCDVLLPPRPLTITSVVVGANSSSAGTTLTADELSDLEVYEDGRVYNPLGWTEGRRNVEIKGTHGYAQVPPRVGLAVRKLAKRYLVDSAVSDRATSMTNDAGQFTYLLTAGVKDQVFDVPECLAVVNQYGVRAF